MNMSAPILIPDPTEYLTPIRYSPKLVLFASFDLVGSSRYKSRYPKEWPNVFIAFFERTFNETTRFRSENRSFKTWKLQGDEILFSFSFKQKETVLGALSHLYETLKKISKELPESLDIKASAWVTLIDDDINKELPKDFLGSFRGDFIGATIDEGFRITKQFCRPGQLALSFDLAYLFLNFSIVNNLYCVGFQRLKGIWNDRYYPVFWYSEDHQLDVDKIPYDREYSCDLTRSFIHERNQPDLDLLKRIEMELKNGVDLTRSAHLHSVLNFLN